MTVHILQEFRQLGERLGAGSRAAAARLGDIGSDMVRAQAAYEARLEDIAEEEADARQRHAEALAALQAQRDAAWADCSAAIAESLQRLRAVSLSLAGAGETVPEGRRGEG